MTEVQRPAGTDHDRGVPGARPHRHAQASRTTVQRGAAASLQRDGEPRRDDARAVVQLELRRRERPTPPLRDPQVRSPPGAVQRHRPGHRRRRRRRRRPIPFTVGAPTAAGTGHAQPDRRGHNAKPRARRGRRRAAAHHPGAPAGKPNAGDPATTPADGPTRHDDGRPRSGSRARLSTPPTGRPRAGAIDCLDDTAARTRRSRRRVPTGAPHGAPDRGRRTRPTTPRAAGPGRASPAGSSATSSRCRPRVSPLVPTPCPRRSQPRRRRARRSATSSPARRSARHWQSCLLLGLGAARELRGRRDWRALRFGS